MEIESGKAKRPTSSRISIPSSTFDLVSQITSSSSCPISSPFSPLSLPFFSFSVLEFRSKGAFQLHFHPQMLSRSPRALFSCLLRTEINTIFTRTLAKTPEDVLPIPGLAEKGEQVQQLLAEDEPKAEEANQQRSTGMGQAEEEPVRKRYQYSMNKLDELNYDVWPYRIERDWWKRGKRTTFWASWRQAQDVLRRELLAEVGPDRLRWKAMKTNNILPRAIIDEFQDKMNKMPRVAHPRCCLNMCQFTGARRGKLNRFRLNKHLFRELADYGKLSGVQRGIW